MLISRLQVHHVPQLAPELMEKHPSVRLSSEASYPEVMKALIDASNTTSIEVDGRLQCIRSMRRRHLGERAGALRGTGLFNREPACSQRDVVNVQRFMKRDSFHVARRLLTCQEAAALEGKLWKL